MCCKCDLIHSHWEWLDFCDVKCQNIHCIVNTKPISHNNMYLLVNFEQVMFLDKNVRLGICTHSFMYILSLVYKIYGRKLRDETDFRLKKEIILLHNAF